MSCLGPCAVCSLTARRPRAGWGAIGVVWVSPVPLLDSLDSSPEFHHASPTWLFLTPISGESDAKSARRVRASSSQYQHYLRQVQLPDGSTDAINEKTPPPNTPNRRFRRAARAARLAAPADEAGITRWSRSDLRICAPRCVWWKEQAILRTQRRARAPIATPVADCFRTMLIFKLPASW